METEYINCMPHKFVLYDEETTAILQELEPSNLQLRAEARASPSSLKYLGKAIVSFAPNYVLSQQSVQDIKQATTNSHTTYILLVSMVMGNVLRDHPLGPHIVVLGPDTGPQAVIRDKDGKVIGTTRLIQYC
ncbi:MAG: hypothetical protein ACTSUE_07675 [Promethearchaeota archaeon]